MPHLQLVRLEIADNRHLKVASMQLRHDSITHALQGQRLDLIRVRVSEPPVTRHMRCDDGAIRRAASRKSTDDRGYLVKCAHCTASTCVAHSMKTKARATNEGSRTQSVRGRLWCCQSAVGVTYHGHSHLSGPIIAAMMRSAVARSRLFGRLRKWLRYICLARSIAASSQRGCVRNRCTSSNTAWRPPSPGKGTHELRHAAVSVTLW